MEHVNQIISKRENENIMKKLKKLFAVMLSLVMVLAMSMTSFAADKNTITISGKGLDAEGAGARAAFITGLSFAFHNGLKRQGRHEKCFVLWRGRNHAKGDAFCIPGALRHLSGQRCAGGAA